MRRYHKARAVFHAVAEAGVDDEVAERIIEGFLLWQSDKGYKRAFITPERLNFPDTPTNPERVAELSARLERGESVPEVTVAERDGEFYLTDGLESAMAYSFNMSTFIPATLTSGGVPECEYVRMKNSI